MGGLTTEGETRPQQTLKLRNLCSVDSRSVKSVAGTVKEKTRALGREGIPGLVVEVAVWSRQFERKAHPLR